MLVTMIMVIRITLEREGDGLSNRYAHPIYEIRYKLIRGGPFEKRLTTVVGFQQRLSLLLDVIGSTFRNDFPLQPGCQNSKSKSCYSRPLVNLGEKCLFELI
jgi:hypothetical protein